MTETIPQMRRRHRDEIRAAIEAQGALRITQAQAARNLNMSVQGLNNIIQRNGIDWPVKRQGVKTPTTQEPTT